MDIGNWSWAIGGLASLLVSLGLVLTKHHHGHFSMDSTIGIQKMHDDPTPRVGGVAIGVGLALPLLWLSEAVATLWMPVLLAACPAFIMGLWEDVTKRVPVSTRLLATMAAGVLGWWFTGVALNRVDVPGVDQLFHFVPVAVLFTAFAVSGAANAVNIVDGFNGLSGGAVILAVGALGLIAGQAGDTAVQQMCWLVCAATLGFLVVNFPFGKIFLGDGGAYTLGFVMGWIAVLIPYRNSGISVWATLLACAYPILETLFSIIRRRRRSHSPGAADRLHMHSLVRRRIVAHVWPEASPLGQNSLTGAVMWIAAAIPAVLAVQWPSNPMVLAICFGLCALIYSALYARLTQFRWCISPATLTLRSRVA